MPDTNDIPTDKDPLPTEAREIHLQKKIVDQYNLNNAHAVKFGIDMWNRTTEMLHDTMPKSHITYNLQLSMFRNFMLDYIQRIVGAQNYVESVDMKKRGWLDKRK